MLTADVVIFGPESGFTNSAEQLLTWEDDTGEVVEANCIFMEGPNDFLVEWREHSSGQVTPAEIAEIAGQELSDGEYRFGAQVRVDGEWSEREFVTFVLDTANPVISNVSAADGAQVSSGTAYVRFDAADPNLDGSASREIAVDLTPGANTITLQASDLAGNTTIQTLTLNSTPIYAGLPAEIEEFRQDLITSNLNLFTFGSGVDAVTGVPIDVIDEVGSIVDVDNGTEGVQTQTQPTAIGFQLTTYGGIIAGLVPEAEGMRQQAIAKMQQSVQTILQEQQDHNRLLVWSSVNPVDPIRDHTASFDNLNLLESVVATIGLLEESGFDDTVAGMALAADLEQVLDNLIDGFADMIVGGLLHREKLLTAATPTGNDTIDRFGAEGRGGTALLVAIGQSNSDSRFPRSVWDNLSLTTRLYRTQEGRVIEAIAPFDGGAFQTLWNTMFLPEQDYESAGLQWNFVVGQVDTASVNNLPGILSASSVPNTNEYQYEGLIGLPALAEQTDRALRDDVASLYGLAGAIPLDPTSVIGQLKRFVESNQDLVGTLGLFDSKITSPTPFGQVSRLHLAIDQLGLIVGLSGAGQVGTRAFLESRAIDTVVADLYADTAYAVNAAPFEFPQPALSPAETTVDAFSQWDPREIRDEENVSADLSGEVLTLRSGIEGGFTGGHLSDTVDSATYPVLVLQVRALTAPASFAVKLGNDVATTSQIESVTLQDSRWTVIELKFDSMQTSSANILLFQNLPKDVDIEIRDAMFLQSPLRLPTT